MRRAVAGSGLSVVLVLGLSGIGTGAAVEPTPLAPAPPTGFPRLGDNIRSLEPARQVIGAPSLDIGYDMPHVGCEAGILYAVGVPF